MGSTSRLTRLELAKQVGVNPETIRFYEKVGLLGTPARSAAGHRRFAVEVVERALFIRRARGLGFALPEIGQLLEVRGGLLAERRRHFLNVIERKLEDLAALRALLVGTAPQSRPTRHPQDCGG